MDSRINRQVAAGQVAALLSIATVAALLFVVACRHDRTPPPEPSPTPEPVFEVVDPAVTPAPSFIIAKAVEEALPPQPPVRHASPKPVPTPATAKEAVKVAIAQLPGMQLARWNKAEVKASAMIAADKAVMLYLRTQSRYEAVERMRPNGVPAPVIFALHYRESSNSFKAHLHEGSSLLARTKYVPKGRPLPPLQPPFTWEVSAEDAIYDADKLQGPWEQTQWSLDRIESYNGMGYRKKGVPSPYLWAGTKVYTSGKYVSDGRYSATAIDQQLGVCAILKRMQEKGVPIRFAD